MIKNKTIVYEDEYKWNHIMHCDYRVKFDINSEIQKENEEGWEVVCLTRDENAKCYTVTYRKEETPAITSPDEKSVDSRFSVFNSHELYILLKAFEESASEIHHNIICNTFYNKDDKKTHETIWKEIEHEIDERASREKKEM